MKLKSDTDTHHISNFGTKSQIYKAGDLINFNSGKNFGLVLQVNEEQLKVIDHQGKIVFVKTADVGKKVTQMRPGAVIQARDKNGNSLSIDQMVRVTEGPHKGMFGPIRHYDRNYLFLWHKDFF